MKIAAADVNKLRKQTGAGMMDCKKALVEAEGDFEAAVDVLRKKGQKIAAKRADRDASEGVALTKINADKTSGVAIVLACETDFVAINDTFKALASQSSTTTATPTHKKRGLPTSTGMLPLISTPEPSLAPPPMTSKRPRVQSALSLTPTT